jgi:hypothetical protein
MRKTSLADAKAHLSELVDEAEHRGKRIVILRHGKPEKKGPGAPLSWWTSGASRPWVAPAGRLVTSAYLELRPRPRIPRARRVALRLAAAPAACPRVRGPRDFIGVSPKSARAAGEFRNAARTQAINPTMSARSAGPWFSSSRRAAFTAASRRTAAFFFPLPTIGI